MNWCASNSQHEVANLCLSPGLVCSKHKCSTGSGSFCGEVLDAGQCSLLGRLKSEVTQRQFLKRRKKYEKGTCVASWRVWENKVQNNCWLVVTGSNGWFCSFTPWSETLWDTLRIWMILGQESVVVETKLTTAMVKKKFQWIPATDFVGLVELNNMKLIWYADMPICLLEVWQETWTHCISLHQWKTLAYHL